MRSNRTAFVMGWILGLILLLLAALSVWGAFGLNDPAWELQFNKLSKAEGPAYGWAIRMGLAALIVILVLVVICSRFGDELTELLPPGTPAPEHTDGKYIWIFRVTFCLLAIGWGGWEASRLFDQRETGPPAQLVSWGYAAAAYDETSWSAHQKLTSAKIAYRWFLPYSLVIYSIVVPLVLVVPAYAAWTKDIPALWGTCANLNFEKARAENMSAEAVYARFLEFKNEWYQRCQRYLHLGGAVAVVLLYYELIGKSAFSEPFRQSTLLTFVVIGLNGCFFIFVWNRYHQEWMNTRSYLRSYPEFKNQLGTDDLPRNFLSRLFAQSFSGYLVLTVLLIPLERMLALS